MGRKPTSFDIAALAGVSQPTVSRALSGNPSVSAETRARVFEAARQLNYTVDKNASGLRRQHSRTLALLFFEDPTPDDTLINPFYLSMLGSMVRRCATRGYDLLISFQQLSGDWHVDYEDSRKADGIILLGYGDYLEYKPRLERLVEQGTHFVRWGSPRQGELGVTIGSNNDQGGYDATRHLLDEGRRRIAFIGTASLAAPEFLDRYNGYARALRALGLEPDPELAADALPTEEAGAAAVRKLLRNDAEFDAIFATSDFAAIGAMQALQELGRKVPDDVAVVGFDDVAAAKLSHPSLTTVAQDARKAGEALVEALIEAVEQGSAATRLLPVSLKVRGSSVVA
ncbi:LacI family transcriptional regulator [Sphingomonas ginkgonis]|uniref:LacI family transcriptional regulator n=1 Tax=Sphingomonas ginkgonis TaxID=2315330 RepID=A0A429V7D2_9SPHN|nr:LacI family DNA-binding transcriptional regulator [Sphingomonas ginkgonis]RST29860.1 LacI family transcriptional regulator [Sphingomonas ginkgonis]